MTQPAFACTVCGAVAAAYAIKCASCGKGMVVQRPNLSVVRSSSGARPASRLTKLPQDAQEPERVDLILPSLNQAFGVNTDGRGGFALRSVVTLAGDPGAGKSTMGLLIGHAFQRAGRTALYFPSESTPEMFSLMAKRTGYGGDLDFCFTDSVSEIEREVQTEPPDLVIVDSLHSLEPRTDSLPHAKRLAKLVQSLEISLLIIGERAKSGTTRGDRGIEYQGDAVMGLDKIDLDGPEKEALIRQDPLALYRRWLVVTKNRHGGSRVERFLLTASGLQEMPPDPPNAAGP